MIEQGPKTSALAYAAYSFQSFYSKAGIAGVYVGTGPDACDEALDRILLEYAKLCEHGIALPVSVFLTPTTSVP